MKRSFYAPRSWHRIQRLCLAHLLLVGPLAGPAVASNGSVVARTPVVNVGNIVILPIRGKVVDASGGAIPGATVVLKGSASLGTTTDAEGAFSLNVPDGSTTLVVSSIGFTAQEITIGNQSQLLVTLQSDVKALSEVVVTGYSSQSRRDITGSVATVDAKELTKVTAPNVAQQLQGRVAGVTVTSNNSPGGEATVRIRGFGTINNNDPLYIIDGVPTKGGLNSINPNNIETMQVLKDASSAGQLWSDLWLLLSVQGLPLPLSLVFLG